MACFSDLPLELVQQVLGGYLNIADLCNVSLVSKSTYAVALPILYEEIECEWNGDNRRGHSVHLLLRSCLRRPALLSLIKRVALRGNKIHDRGVDQKFLEEDVKLGLRISPPWIDFREVAKQDAELFAECTSVTVALLISQLPNLESLHVDNPKLVMQLAFRNLIKCMFSRDTTMDLRSLRHFLLLHDFPRNDRFPTLFYLPCIESITMSLREPPSPIMWPTQRPHASTLVKLDLQSSTIKEESLAALLSTTPNLKIFRYDFHCDADPTFPDESTYLQCEKLAVALHQLQATLEELSISVSFYATSAMEVDSGSDWGIQGNLGSLRDFSRLHYLEIPVTVLLGWSAEVDETPRLGNVLPPVLRHFYLKDDLFNFDNYSWDSKSYLAQFKDFVHVAKSNTPVLDTITLNLIRDEAGGKEENLNQIVALCKTVGIKCTVDT